MASFNGFRLDVLGSQQLVLEGCDVGDALLLESLETSIKCLLQMDAEETIPSIEGATQREGKGGGYCLRGYSTCLVRRVWTEDRSLP